MATLELKGTIEKELENVEEMGLDARSVGVKGNSYKKTRAQRMAEIKKANREISTEEHTR